MNTRRPKRKHFKKQLEIIFEDRDLIVANKDAGILSVPLRGDVKGAQSPNLLKFVNDYLAHKKQRALVVHRIDRYTSGLVLFAKNPSARARLIKQFIAHTPAREYLALVRGELKPEEGALINYLRLSKDGFRQVVLPKGTPDATKAELRYKTIAVNDELSLVQINLVTGLKNQIRVQFAAIKHPIVGDRHYQASETYTKEIDRQALHAIGLSFEQPHTKELITVRAPLPNDLRRLLEKHKFQDVDVLASAPPRNNPERGSKERRRRAKKRFRN